MGATILAIILFVYIFWIGSFFPTVKPMMDSYNEMLSNPTMKAFLGDLADLTTFSGFITAEVFSYMGIVLGAYVAFLTASFAAGEIEQKSSELMLSLPVSRQKVLLSRFATLLPIIVVLMVRHVASHLLRRAVHRGERGHREVRLGHAVHRRRSCWRWAEARCCSRRS